MSDQDYLDKAISVKDETNLHDVTFEIDSDTSSESPDENNTLASNHASEAVRRKRQICLMVFSFFPFLLASAALGLIVVGGKNGTGSTLPNDGEATGIEASDPGNSGSVTASDPGTISPSAMRASPAPTSYFHFVPESGSTARYPTVSPAEQNGGVRVTPSPTAPPPSSVVASDEDHGNLRSTSSPTPLPTSSAPTSAIATLVDIGNGGLPAADFPLGECQGDCDNDSECQSSLVCFLRDAFAPVPGCTGNGNIDTDYCVVRPLNYLSTSTTFPLEFCQGDCDSDDDCASDLICEQRNGVSPIPGCEGTGETNSDYCRYPDLPTAEEESVVAASPNNPSAGSSTNPPTTKPPTTQPSATCTASGASCEDKKITCCSGVCEKDKDTKQKLCGYSTNNAAPNNFQSSDNSSCDGSGASCNDKKMCCSGVCEKDKETKEKICD
mmetsp:Transcript_2625/g.5642  ORF Transcript_2625/g.5642 Transcript_2625/m.5642 type:complete len:440 (-) Transcript_2625:343-1662(-)